jgi:catalase (peroxidase I)
MLTEEPTSAPTVMPPTESDGLSWADLIIIASTTALESMGALPMPFCPGRTDVSASLAKEQSANLDPEIYLDPETATADLLRESMKIMGFTDREMVVLNGGGHSIGQCHHFRSGFSGPWTHNPAKVSNEFFSLLISEEWVVTSAPHNGRKQFQDQKTETLTMLFSDLVFRDDDRFRAIVEEYAQDNDLFLEDFRKAWIKLVNADRFGDVCVTADEGSTKSPEITMPDQKADMTEPIQVHCNDNSSDSKYSTMVWVLVAILFLIIVAQFAFMYTNTPKQALVKEIEMPDFTGSQHGGAMFDVESK